MCEVRFREWTPDGVLRHPAFLRMRADKNPRDCEPPGRTDPGTGERCHGEPASATTEEPPAPRDAPPEEKTVTFSNLKKIYWPAERYTKGDLIDYYRAISPWMLPYLRDRPLVLTRFPDGIDGKSFYQKDAPEFAPSWIAAIPIWSEDTQRDIRYFVCDDVESLLYVANMGSIPIAHLGEPRRVAGAAGLVRDRSRSEGSAVLRCDQMRRRASARCATSIGLPSYVKTTGKTGLHILLPLGRQLTYAQSRTLGELLARVVLRELDRSRRSRGT